MKIMLMMMKVKMVSMKMMMKMNVMMMMGMKTAFLAQTIRNFSSVSSSRWSS